MAIPTKIEFSSPADPKRRVVLNQDPEIPVLTQAPTRSELIHFLSEFERSYVDAFWTNLLCKPSPFVRGIPFGVAASNGGLTLLPIGSVLAAAERLIGRKAVVGKKGATEFSMAELTASVMALKPSTISEANDCLQKSGQGRFLAFSLVDLAQRYSGFEELASEIVKRVINNGTTRTLAVNVLVAMRARQWLVLPTEVNRYAGLVIRAARAKDRAWADPLNFAGKSLNGVYRKLLETNQTLPAYQTKIAEAKARYAIFCTSIQSVEELTWPLANELLKKSANGGQNFDTPTVIRKHWRDLCRANAGASDAGKQGFEPEKELSSEAEVQEDWIEEAEPTKEGSCQRLEFGAPNDANFKVVFNRDQQRPIILGPVPRVELFELSKQVERDYIRTFWQALAAASPHIEELPYALAGSSSGHSLVRPTVVYERLTGHTDVTDAEALKELRRYPMTELKTAVAASLPETITDAQQRLTESGRIRFPAFSLISLLQRHQSFETLAAELLQIATRQGQFTGKSFAQYVLVSFRAKSWIVLPEALNAHIGHVLRGIHAKDREWGTNPMDALSGQLKKLYRALAGEAVDEPDHRSVSMQFRKCRQLILCSNVRGTRDLSMPLVEVILASDGEAKARGDVIVSAATRARWQKLCEANGPAALRPISKVNDHRAALIKRCPYDDRLSEWVDVLSSQAELHEGGNLDPIYQAYAAWLCWLATLSEIPKPLEIARKHIRDDLHPTTNTFRAYLAAKDYSITKNRNLPLMKMHMVFSRLSMEAEDAGQKFLNPIRIDFDKFVTPRREKPTGTIRSRIPDWVMVELKRLIVEDKGPGRYAWGTGITNMQSLWVENGRGKKVFCPILPAILYMMLVYPLRTHQARWLDSGEMDEEIYDFKSRTFSKNVHGLAGRASGVLQPAQSCPVVQEDTKLEFQVAVNKSLLEKRHRSAFTIPYVSQEMLWVIQQVREWQLKNGPAPHLVKEVHEPVNEKRRNQKQADFYPDICPLFRYRDQSSFYPPSHQQISYFWGKLCRLWDDKNENWRDPKTGENKRNPVAPQLSREYVDPDGKRIMDVAIYDLHSLRVAGVSMLLDADVPLGMVVSIVGHGSPAMTLWYFRTEQAAMRVKLHEAYKKLGSNAALEEIYKRVRESDDESWLRSSRDGFDKLRQARKTGLLSISTSGICPGATCESGLDPEYAQQLGRNVPGSKCPLCRFFIYGPPFLMGLVYDYNCLLFDLERKADLHRQIREEAMAAEDAGETGRLIRLRGEDDRLERETTLDLKVLARLYTMIDECIALINNEHEKPTGVELIVSNGEKLSAIVERVGKFQQLKDLVEIAQVIPPSRHTVPIFAEMELKDRLLDFLRRNGAECYLAGLPKEVSKKATLQLARLLEQLVPQDDLRQKLVDGAVKLKDLPGVETQVLTHIQQSSQQLGVEKIAKPSLLSSNG